MLLGRTAALRSCDVLGGLAASPGVWEPSYHRAEPFNLGVWGNNNLAHLAAKYQRGLLLAIAISSAVCTFWTPFGVLV